MVAVVVRCLEFKTCAWLVLLCVTLCCVAQSTTASEGLSHSFHGGGRGLVNADWNELIEPQQQQQHQQQQQQRDLQSNTNTTTNYCITGYIMDTFCIVLQTLLDNQDLLTLQSPDQHSVHCLTEVSSCVLSGYEVLSPPNVTGGNYTRTVKLDAVGNTKVYNLAKLTGICGSCSGKGTISRGFRATVTGVLAAAAASATNSNNNPPILNVDQVLPANVSCASLFLNSGNNNNNNNNSPPPTPKPTIQPTKPTLVVGSTLKPSGSPTFKVNVKPGVCFSEANTVQVAVVAVDKQQHKNRKDVLHVSNNIDDDDVVAMVQEISMKHLKIGDLVKDARGNMVRVYSFGHYQPHVKTEYLQIHAKGLIKPLEISRDHLLFVVVAKQDGGLSSNKAATAIPASLVSIGDKLQLEHPGQVAEVTAIKVVKRAGVYAPFTSSGTILVNGVAASNYVTLQTDSPVLVLGGGGGGSSSSSSRGLGFGGSYYYYYATTLSMHWLSHLFQTPHRMICLGWSMKICQSEKYTNEEGISTWMYKPMLVGQWLLLSQQQQPWLQAILLIPALLVGLLLHAVELVFLQQHHGVWMLLLLAITMAATTFLGTACGAWHKKFHNKRSKLA